MERGADCRRQKEDDKVGRGRQRDDCHCILKNVSCIKDRLKKRKKIAESACCLYRDCPASHSHSQTHSHSDLPCPASAPLQNSRHLKKNSDFSIHLFFFIWNKNILLIKITGWVQGTQRCWKVIRRGEEIQTSKPSDELKLLGIENESKKMITKTLWHVQTAVHHNLRASWKVIFHTVRLCNEGLSPTFQVCSLLVLPPNKLA